MDSPFALPELGVPADADGWASETLRYLARPRGVSKFKTLFDAHRLFGKGGAQTTIVTRTRPPSDGEQVLELSMCTELPKMTMEDRFSATWDNGLIAAKLESRMGAARKSDVDFAASPFRFPSATYPEVLLPFLMRGQPRDDKVRATYAWTSDRFVARVYYESRKLTTIDVPAGTFEAHLVWMYPDLNDWIALGGLVTKLAKPLLPRYEMWFEVAPPHRVLRFEGAYGPARRKS